MNSYFSTIEEKLADELAPPPPVIECREPEVIQNLSGSAEPPPLLEIKQTNLYSHIQNHGICSHIQNHGISGSVKGSVKVHLLKMNKSTSSDHIPPKLAGTAIVPALVALFRFRVERGGCTGLKFP